MSLWLRILLDALAKLNASASRPDGADDAELARILAAPVPSVLIYAREDESRRATTRRSPVNTRSLTLAVECRAAGSTEVDCYTNVAPFMAWASKALDGVILDGSSDVAMETGFTTEIQGDDKPYILVTMTFAVLYQQRVGDAAQAT